MKEKEAEKGIAAGCIAMGGKLQSFIKGKRCQGARL